MSTLRRLAARAWSLGGQGRTADRLREEMEAHIAAQTEDNLRAGMPAEEARRSARIKFGSAVAVHEQYHAEKGLPWLETLLMDVRYAVRVLWKAPAFTLVALLTLTLGVGANLVVFGVVNAVLVQPLAVHDPQTLYQLRHKPWMAARLLTTSYPTFQDLERRSTTLLGMAALNAYSSAALSWGGNAVQSVSGDEVSGNYFDLLGVQPELGRFFHAADEHGPNSAPYLVVSDALWRKTFHADPSVIGKTVELNKHPFTVIGITSARFHGTERFVWPDYWLPMVNAEQVKGYDYLHDRAATTVTVLARLKPGVTVQQATENLDAVALQLGAEYPQTETGLPMRLIHPGLLGDDGDVIRGFLLSVAVLALLVLAAACANLATLFAARAADRSRELALRAALGSSRGRLVRQLLTEAAMVSLLGGAAGLAGASVLLAALNRWNSSLGHLDVHVDGRVYLAGLLLTLSSALLFGLVPARHAWQSSPLQMMKSGPVQSLQLRRLALRDVLLGAQIAICTVLVTASLVAVRGMVHALHAPIGIRPRGAVLAEMDLSQGGQNTDALYREVTKLAEAARSLSGVTGVGVINATPLGGGGSKGVPIYAPGTTEFTLKNYALQTRQYAMSPGYLEAAGTRLLSGRDVHWQDTPATPAVAVVNQTFARRMWGVTPAIGQRFIVAGRLTEVVGVAEDGKYHDLEESPQPAVYLPLAQSMESEVVFVVRSRMASNETAAAVEHTLRDIEPDAPLSVEDWPGALSSVLFPARAATVALGVMGLLAAMLAITGIFGMAAYSVSRRTKELGIRMALGARKLQVVRAAVGRPVVLLGVGSALGLLAGVFASRLLAQIVFQANPRDPFVLLGVVLTMALLGVVASAIPARRALAVDPSKLMREQ